VRCKRPVRNSLDHLVGAGEQHRGTSMAEHPGGLGVDDQLELARLHHRQVSGLRVAQGTLERSVRPVITIARARVPPSSCSFCKDTSMARSAFLFLGNLIAVELAQRQTFFRD
jgi:hypothetical protein